jgi:hypothetical protein
VDERLIFKIVFKEAGLEDSDWIYLAYDGIQ